MSGATHGIKFMSEEEIMVEMRKVARMIDGNPGLIQATFDWAGITIDDRTVIKKYKEVIGEDDTNTQARRTILVLTYLFMEYKANIASLREAIEAMQGRLAK